MTVISTRTEWSMYADARRGFRLEHPADWDVRPGLAGLLVAIVAPSENGNDFRSNVNVVRKTGVGSRDLDELAQNAIREVGRILTDLLVIDIDAAVVAGLSARRLLFSYRQGMFGLTAEQWLMVEEDKHWTISASASSDRYNSIADEFAAIVASVEVTDD
jgi:hypothetical protein